MFVCIYVCIYIYIHIYVCLSLSIHISNLSIYYLSIICRNRYKHMSTYVKTSHLTPVKASSQKGRSRAPLGPATRPGSRPGSKPSTARSPHRSIWPSLHSAQHLALRTVNPIPKRGCLIKGGGYHI